MISAFHASVTQVSWARRRLHSCLASAVFLVWAMAGAAPAVMTGPAILGELRSFDELGSVLYIAAHPDDENTQLIAYLAGGRHYRTAYLSLTRGDGGQNVLGPEFGEELGVIRTQELLAARRVDGGRQFFSRAIDFGFSKDYRETLRFWDRQQVLSDVVRVIRTFRPDVIIARFSAEPGGTHGHHTASTVLAREAFKLAGDPHAFPEQLSTLSTWQAKRLLWNSGGFQRSPNPDAPVLRISVDGTNDVTGESFSAIAVRSRAMHKTQGFDNFRGFGGGGPRTESFQLLEGEPATNDIMDGVNTSWTRFPGGEVVERMTRKIMDSFKPDEPSASAPQLAELSSNLLSMGTNPIIAEKRQQLDGILQDCLGLSVETTVASAEVVPGDTLSIRHVVSLKSSIPVRWIGVRYPSLGTTFKKNVSLRSGEASELLISQVVPAGTPLTQPYWLKQDHEPGTFHVPDTAMIGLPENPPAFPVEYLFEAGTRFVVIDQPVQIDVTAPVAQSRRPLVVVPPVWLKFPSTVELFSPGAKRPVNIEVIAGRTASGSVSLDAPQGWVVTPAAASFQLAKGGDRTRLQFTVTAPSKLVSAQIGARARIGDMVVDSERIELLYKHIPVQLLQPPARFRAVSLDLAIRGHEVGYVPGAGDSMAECLGDMGYAVTKLSGSDLTTNRLKDFDAVVIGIRAFNVRTDLVSQLPALFDFIQHGGNVVVQYNRPGNDLKTDHLAPFDLRLSNDRVTDETAAMTFLAPEHPALNVPNRITQADFDGWVQERGLYFPTQWAEEFTPILACSDPGEAPKAGGLLVARYGKGYFVYTGLAFFRQLPDGVPGAYRLFANLVSLGK